MVLKKQLWEHFAPNECHWQQARNTTVWKQEDLRHHCGHNRAWHVSVMEITAWTQEHFQKSLCHPQIQVKALSCEEEALCEDDPGTQLSSLKCNEAKCKTVLGSDYISVFSLKACISRTDTCTCGKLPSMLRGIYRWQLFQGSPWIF